MCLQVISKCKRLGALGTAERFLHSVSFLNVALGQEVTGVFTQRPAVELCASSKMLLLFKMFIELLHYYVMAQSQWAHYNTV